MRRTGNPDSLRRWSWRFAPLCTALVAAGCPKVPTQTAAMQTAPGIDASADQLQLRVFEIGRQLSSEIALTADTIERSSNASDVRLRALEWRVSATPLVQDAALQNDPLVAALDLAAFSVQQREYFDTGEGREAFGALQPVAVRAAKAMEDDVFAQLGRSTVGGSMSPVYRDTLTVWAKRHPIRGASMERQSLLGSDWSGIGLSGSSLGATAGSIDRSVRLLTLRLSYLNETLSEQMRWNARLVMAEALATPGGDSLFRQTATAVRNVGALAGVVPDVLAHERAALLVGVDRERALALADVDRQRVATLGLLTAERTSLEAAIDKERQAVMAGVTAERIATMRSADSLIATSMERANAAATRLVLKALVVGLILIAALIAGALLIVRHWRHTDPQWGASATPR